MMKYLLPSVLVVCMVGILVIPSASAFKTVTVENEPGSSVSGCQPNCFTPNPVRINPGDTVVWTNPDTMYHIVTSGTTVDGKDGIFDSGFIFPGNTFSYKFHTSGTYNYFCSAHPWMEGTVLVSGGTSSASEISTKLTLDPLPASFKAKGSDSSAEITFSGKLESADGKLYFYDAEIKLVFKGLTFGGKDHYSVSTSKTDGTFNKKLLIPVGKKLECSSSL